MTWLPSPAPLAARAAVLGGIVILGAPFASQVGRGLSDIRAPRLSASSPDRGQETAAAIRLVRGHPVAGTGPGRAVLAWAGPDGGARFAHYVHDEYLQVLVELGAVGLALLASLLVAGGLALRGARTRASHPELWAGAVAGLAALAVHSAFDFLWHLAVIPMLAALLVGIVCPIALEETS
jgi:O-antigen ligase